MATADYGRAEAEWDRTAHLLSMLANTVRDPKKRPAPFSPAEFHPFRSSHPVANDDGPGDLSIIRKVLEQCHRPQAR